MFYKQDGFIQSNRLLCIMISTRGQRCSLILFLQDRWFQHVFVSSVSWRTSPPNPTLWSWNISSSQVWKVCLERWDGGEPGSVLCLFFPFISMLFNLQVGAALDFDVLKYSDDALTAVLRVHSRWVVTVGGGGGGVGRSGPWPRSRCPTCFQRFGEPVELSDPAGLLPEPGLRLQGAAGEQPNNLPFHAVAVKRGLHSFCSGT